MKKITNKKISPRWKGKYYDISINTYYNRFSGKDEIVSISLSKANGGGIVKSVSPYDIGYLFQYTLNKRQMDYLDELKAKYT